MTAKRCPDIVAIAFLKERQRHADTDIFSRPKILPVRVAPADRFILVISVWITWLLAVVFVKAAVPVPGARPVLIVPDIMGHSLYDQNGKQIWLKYDNNDQYLDHNDLLCLPETYFIVGTGRTFDDQTALTTLSSVSVSKELDLAAPLIENQDMLEEQFETTEGDGIVPLLSATMMEKLDEMLSGTNRYLRLETEHAGTCLSDEAIDWIESTLNSTPEETGNIAAADDGTAEEESDSAKSGEQGYITAILTTGSWHRRIETNITSNEWLQFYPGGEVRYYTDVTWLGQMSEQGIQRHEPD
jgi:hypothetical protein